MTRQFHNRVALVTGGSRGIGAAIVRRLASDGASVAFTYSSSEKQALELVSEVEEAGGIAFAIKADSAVPEAVRGAVARAVARFGRLDVLVNNAGILLRGTVDDFDLADFDRMVAINIRAVFVATQAAIPHLQGGARIITTGSIAAERAGFPGASVYSMTKGAVAALTRGLARDLGPRGITVNAVQPGPTETDMNASSEVHDMLKPLIALGRIGKDQEVASLVAYLASPESSFVTGACLNADGGYLA
jgi:3-oxoacyl-[acyl-carrier protein] reductase